MGIADHLICLLRNLYVGQEATVGTLYGTMDWCKIGKGVRHEAVYCHPAYLTYIKNTSCEMPSWMNHKLESRFAIQSLSHVRLFGIPWIAAHQASLSFTISWSLLKYMSIESVMPCNHLVFCHPLLLLPSIFPSIRVFSNESDDYREKYQQPHICR